MHKILTDSDFHFSQLLLAAWQWRRQRFVNKISEVETWVNQRNVNSKQIVTKARLILFVITRDWAWIWTELCFLENILKKLEHRTSKKWVFRKIVFFTSLVFFWCPRFYFHDSWSWSIMWDILSAQINYHSTSFFVVSYRSRMGKTDPLFGVFGPFWTLVTMKEK